MPDRVFVERAHRQYASALQTQELGKKFVLLDEVDSTNAYIRRMPDDESAKGLAVAALRQSAGRGRLGRRWISDEGGLYFSFAVLIEPVFSPKLPLAAAAAIVAAFDALGIAGTGIKWPNDILISGKKLVGILCQSWGRRVAVGIGVNLTQTQTAFAEAGLPDAVSLAMLGKRVDPWELMARIITYAEQDIDLVQTDTAALLDTYRARCVSLGRMLVAGGENGEICGVGRDIDEEGRLLLETEQGIVAVSSGEVRLRGRTGYV